MSGSIVNVQRGADGSIQVLEAYVNRGEQKVLDVIKRMTCYKKNNGSEILYNVTDIIEESAQVRTGKHRGYTVTTYHIYLQEKNGEDRPVVALMKNNTTDLSRWIPCPTFPGGRRRSRRHKRKAKKTRKSRNSRNSRR